MDDYFESNTYTHVDHVQSITVFWLASNQLLLLRQIQYLLGNVLHTSHCDIDILCI